MYLTLGASKLNSTVEDPPAATAWTNNKMKKLIALLEVVPILSS